MGIHRTVDAQLNRNIEPPAIVRVYEWVRIGPGIEACSSMK
jgi:hypothetical protein